MTFRKFRKKYKIINIEVCSTDQKKHIGTYVDYEKGCAKGICIHLENKEEFEFRLFCKISPNEIVGEWKQGDKGQVKIIK